MANPGPPRPADIFFPERRVAILADKCVSCAADVTVALMPAEDASEYVISGLCTPCQEVVFNEGCSAPEGE